MAEICVNGYSDALRFLQENSKDVLTLTEETTPVHSFASKKRLTFMSHHRADRQRASSQEFGDIYRDTRKS